MKYSMFIGRWQPWHDGHRWLIDQRLNQDKNVLICIREVSKDDSNPYNPIEVKKNIEKELQDLILKKKVKVVIIPDIESVNYGRGVGYDIIEHVPPKKVASASHSSWVGTCHPSGHTPLPSTVANQLYNLPYSSP